MIPAHPCHNQDCAGTCSYVDDDYGSLGSGGSYEIYKCDTCGAVDYSPLPD